MTETTLQKIAKELPKIEPRAQIDIEYIEISKDRKVIAITVLPGKHLPYIYDGRAYQRDINDTNRMSQHLYEQKLLARNQLNYSWESFVSDKYDINDLDKETIYKTVNDGIRSGRIPASSMQDTIEEILLRFQLTEENRLKNAALVLFAADHVVLPQCQMKMARFQGKDKLGDFIDNRSISGNAFKLLNEADSFVRRHLPIASIFNSNSLKRFDMPALPVMAIREALVNALCHKNYADSQSDLSLAIFDDRLEIWNSGLLPENLTLKSLKETHESILRNKIIANVFYIRDYIEKWGTGTNKMVELCRRENIPEPEFSERTGGILVTFWFRGAVEDYDEYEQIEQEPGIILNERQQEILNAIKNYKELSIQNLLSVLENPPSQRMVQKDLHYLKDCGLVDIQGSSRKVVWVEKNNK